jgi:hypothetical protein
VRLSLVSTPHPAHFNVTLSASRPPALHRPLSQEDMEQHMWLAGGGGEGGERGERGTYMSAHAVSTTATAQEDNSLAAVNTAAANGARGVNSSSRTYSGSALNSATA